jgi:hypothetical protein
MHPPAAGHDNRGWNGSLRSAQGKGKEGSRLWEGVEGVEGAWDLGLGGWGRRGGRPMTGRALESPVFTRNGWESLSYYSIDLTMVASPFASRCYARRHVEAVGIERGKAWSLHPDVKVGCFYPLYVLKLYLFYNKIGGFYKTIVKKWIQY